ncbi:unnamed protein product, partial [Dicrocoelium dendriticum]
MGTAVSHLIRPTRSHKRFVRKKGRKGRRWDITAQECAIVTFGDELQLSTHRVIPPILHNLAGFTSVTDTSAKSVLPVAFTSRPYYRQDGEHATEKLSPNWEPADLEAAGDRESGSNQSIENSINKLILPITYCINMNIAESPLTRVMFLELYGLDMNKLSQEQFTDWASLAKLPRTAQMYEQFQHDAKSFAVRHTLTTLENRFDVRVTIGDYVPSSADSDVKEMMKLSGVIHGGREVFIYGASASKINSAVNYLWATLSQLKMDQLLLPDKRKYSGFGEVDLMQWIKPLAPDAPEPLLMRLRRRAI